MSATFIFLSIYLLPFACSSTSVGIILPKNQENDLKAIISTVRSALNLQLSLNSVVLSDENIAFVEPGKVHELSQIVFAFKNRNVTVILGPPDSNFGNLIREFCFEQNIYFLSYNLNNMFSKNEQFFQLYPIFEFEKMVKYLLQYWRWNKYSVIFSKSKGLQNAHYFISKSVSDIYFFEIEDDVDENHEDPFIQATRKLRDSCEEENCWKFGNRVLVELDKEDTMKFLHSSLKLGLINSKNWYFLLGIDSFSKGMEDYRHNSVMFSTVTLFDEELLRRNTTYQPFIKEYETKIGKNKICSLVSFNIICSKFIRYYRMPLFPSTMLY